MPALAALAGLLLGSLPTADLLVRRRGIDLRTAGSRNPGTRNALAEGGKSLAAYVLGAEILKGAAAVYVGGRLAGDAGAALAGVTATWGNVYNPWFGFQGGKGLGISAGILGAAWPPMLVVAVVMIALTVMLLRRSGPAALLTFGVYLACALANLWVDLTVGWGVTSPPWLLALASGSVAVMTPKHVHDTLRPAR